MAALFITGTAEGGCMQSSFSNRVQGGKAAPLAMEAVDQSRFGRNE